MERMPAMLRIMSQLESRINSSTLEGGSVPIDAKRTVEDVAKENGVSEKTMITQLRKAGALPFKLGKIWWIREIQLVEVYEKLERTCDV